MQVLPIERGMLKCVFRYPEQDGVPGNVYATLSVIGLLVEQGMSGGVKLVPIVLDDTLWTASDFADEHAPRLAVIKPLEWEVCETTKGAEADSDNRAPFWFQLFFESYLHQTPLDFRGVEIPVWLQEKLKLAVETGAITQLREGAWSNNQPSSQRAVAVATPSQRGTQAS